MRVVAAAVGLVAVAVVTLGWLGSPDRLTATEAATVAAHAYEAAGMDAAVVDPKPQRGVYTTVNGDARILVWKTMAAVDGGTIQLWLSRADGESVFLDDRSADGTTQLLTDEQFSRLAEHYENPTVTRQIHRNLLLTLAAGLIVLLAVRLSVLQIPADARRLLGLGGTRGRPGPRTDAHGGERTLAAPRVVDDTRAPLAAAVPEPELSPDDLDDLDDLDEQDVPADEEDWDLQPDSSADEGDEWEPMWHDDPSVDAETTADGEWAPMWDDNPSGAASADMGDAFDTAPAPEVQPDERVPRLRASGTRRLRAPEAR